MKVIAYDPFLSPERALELGVEKVDLGELIKRADFVTLHTPLTDKTKNIIDASALATMKKGVRIVNRARGGLVDEQALRTALDPATLPGPLSTCSPRSRRPRTRCSATPTWCARRISVPPPARRENVALQVAEQMSDYLLRGRDLECRQLPSITAEEAPRLGLFIELAEKLGSFAGQLTETGIGKVQLSYEGGSPR
jgi:D-3-phosphoglycerate dehydrogenase